MLNNIDKFLRRLRRDFRGVLAAESRRRAKEMADKAFRQQAPQEPKKPHPLPKLRGVR